MLTKISPEKTLKEISKGTPSHNKKTNFFKTFDTDGSAPSHGRRKQTSQKSKKTKLPAFTPWKVVLASFLIGICGIFYISHVFNTQQALLEVNRLEIEHNRAMRLYHEKRLIFDRMTGPKEIYQKAREQGFMNAGPANQIIIIESEEK